MGWAILFVVESVKLIIVLIIKGLKLWWGAICWCFTFFLTAIDELKTLKWENENDRSKIVKNGIIITASIGVAIFLIWLLISIFSGKFGSSSNNNYKKSNSKQVTAVNKRYGWEKSPNNANEFVFYDENEKMVKNKDYKVNGFWYYFDDKGYMIKDKWHGDYYYGADGKMVTNQ